MTTDTHDYRNYSSLISEIRNARTARGLTQDKLAEKIGLSGSAVSKIESRNYVTSMTYFYIAQILAVLELPGISSDDFYLFPDFIGKRPASAVIKPGIVEAEEALKGLESIDALIAASQITPEGLLQRISDLRGEAKKSIEHGEWRFLQYYITLGLAGRYLEG